MRRRSIYPLVMVAYLAQSYVAPLFKIGGAAPQPVLISVIFAGLFFGGAYGLRAGALGGLLIDISAFDHLGINAFTLALTGFIIGLLNTKFSRESAVARFVITAVFSLFSYALRYFLESRFSSCQSSVGFGELVLASGLGSAIYTALAAVPAFTYLIKMYGIAEEEDLI